MRLLYFCESYRPYIGGVETLSEALLRDLQRRGHEVCVVTNQRRPSDPAREEIAGIPVLRLPMSWALSVSRLEAVGRIVGELAEFKRQFRPEVVHVAWSGPSDFYHWRSGPPVPTLVTLHCTPPRGPVTRSLCERARRVVAVSSALGDFPVIANGYPAPSAPRVPLPAAPVVLALGRMVHDKGFDLLIDAWPVVRERLPRARLVLAGDGPERPRLAGAGVAAIGWIAPDQVFAAVDAARVVAIPSRWNEPFGLVALDAAWRERPVVAARRGGLVDIIDDGRTGLLVEPESREELGGALITLLTDDHLATAMGRAARLRAEQHFSMDRMVEAYECAYGEIA